MSCIQMLLHTDLAQSLGRFKVREDFLDIGGRKVCLRTDST
jgi:hypothetical protein